MKIDQLRGQNEVQETGSKLLLCYKPLQVYPFNREGERER